MLVSEPHKSLDLIQHYPDFQDQYASIMDAIYLFDQNAQSSLRGLGFRV